MKYTNEQKEKIMMESDLLGESRSREKQGFALGFALEKLAQKGVELLFVDDGNFPGWLVKKFKDQPLFLYTIGNKQLLKNEDVETVTSYLDFKRGSNPKIFISDRPMEELMSYRIVIERLLENKLLIVSNMFNEKSILKNVEEKLIDEETRGISKKVFISGSRSQNEIPVSIQKSLEAIIQQNIHILIGDSEKGVDNNILDYLRLDSVYPHVEVFTVNQNARVKVESKWTKRHIETEPESKGQEKQMVKDRMMADEAHWGLAVFDPFSKTRFGKLRVSSGTLRNTIQMLLEKKPVKFHYVYESELKESKLKTIEDLKEVLDSYALEKRSPEISKEKTSLNSPNLISLEPKEKHQMLMKKFEELKRKEEKILVEKNKSVLLKKQNFQLSLF